MYKPPTYISNPGPGTHFKSLKFTGNPSDLDQSRAKYLTTRHREMAVKPSKKSASIPSRKANQNAYQGFGFDTVGPAVYNPNVSFVKGRAPIGDFISSKQ